MTRIEGFRKYLTFTLWKMALPLFESKTPVAVDERLLRIKGRYSTLSRYTPLGYADTKEDPNDDYLSRLR